MNIIIQNCLDSGSSPKEEPWKHFLVYPHLSSHLKLLFVCYPLKLRWVLGSMNQSKTTGEYILVVHDITQLRQLNSMRRDFISNVSHELRTPLQSIKMGLETINDGAAKNDKENQKKNDWDRRGLPGWTYHSEALFNLESEELFRRRWQFVCHANELRKIGSFKTIDRVNERGFVIKSVI